MWGLTFRSMSSDFCRSKFRAARKKERMAKGEEAKVKGGKSQSLKSREELVRAPSLLLTPQEYIGGSLECF